MLRAPFENALVLTGPTCSGKTDLALELAPLLGAEIVSMDSMALYRGLDIGTAKPTPAQRALVPHHLIDELDPAESASVAWWLTRAAECCRAIEARGRRPLFVGGTPLYLKALIEGLFEGPSADPSLRDELMQLAQVHGPDFLHAQLRQVDPVSAERLHPNDIRRVVRALEVVKRTGKPLSAWQTQWRPTRCSEPTVPDTAILCLDLPRPELHRRINQRVRSMFEAGFVEEVRRLGALGREARQAVGYAEVLDHLAGQLCLDDAIARTQARTRQFAKRQMTWFRRLPGCQLVEKQLTFSLWSLKMKM
jgi:tRNA dimethylallyltransferase